MKKRISILICSLIFCAICFPLNADAEETTLKHLDLRAKFSYGKGKFDIYGEKHSIPNYGMRLEVLRGFEVPTMPGLEVGLSASYLTIGKRNSFDVDIDPTPQGVSLRPCEMTTTITGTMLVARYKYNFALGSLPIGFENGIGLGNFYLRNDWKIEKLDGTDLESDQERVTTLEPVFDFGLNIHFLEREHSKLAFSISGLWLPVFIDIDGPTLWGHYKLEFIGEFGLNWQVIFQLFYTQGQARHRAVTGPSSAGPRNRPTERPPV